MKTTVAWFLWIMVYLELIQMGKWWNWSRIRIWMILRRGELLAFWLAKQVHRIFRMLQLKRNDFFIFQIKIWISVDESFLAMDDGPSLMAEKTNLIDRTGDLCWLIGLDLVEMDRTVSICWLNFHWFIKYALFSVHLLGICTIQRVWPCTILTNFLSQK